MVEKQYELHKGKLQKIRMLLVSALIISELKIIIFASLIKSYWCNFDAIVTFIV